VWRVCQEQLGGRATHAPRPHVPACCLCLTHKLRLRGCLLGAGWPGLPQMVGYNPEPLCHAHHVLCLAGMAAGPAMGGVHALHVALFLCTPCHPYLRQLPRSCATLSWAEPPAGRPCRANVQGCASAGGVHRRTSAQ
jgi:hypothetical protein